MKILKVYGECYGIDLGDEVEIEGTESVEELETIAKEMIFNNIDWSWEVKEVNV